MQCNAVLGYLVRGLLVLAVVGQHGQVEAGRHPGLQCTVPHCLALGLVSPIWLVMLAARNITQWNNPIPVLRTVVTLTSLAVPHNT